MHSLERIRRLARDFQAVGLIYWTAGSAVLNLAWEVAHVRLYRISPGHLGAVPALAIAHCLAGDVLVSALAYILAVVAGGTWRWPVARPSRGILVAVAFSVTFTVVAEWLSVRVLGRWSYLPNMPTVLGIGLSPLLQAMVVPAAALLLTRWRLMAATRTIRAGGQLNHTDSKPPG